jgi:hypothetical protein
LLPLGTMPRHHNSVEEHEQSYRVTFECQGDEIFEKVTVNGITGHTLKLKNSDSRLLTIEDKSICLSLNDSAIAQARSEMMSELEELQSMVATNGNHLNFMLLE